MSPGRCPHRNDVDEHFAGRLSIGREQKLRAHLPECAVCRDRYARQLKLETIDPRALGFTERMRRGLGLARPAFAGRLLGFGGLGAALALGAMLLLPRLPHLAQPAPDERFASDGVRARGGEAELPLVLSLDDGTEIAGFRTSGPGAPAPATDRLPAQAELAFTYRNTGGWSHLMVFARDGRGEVYWFYPQWTDPASDPAGVELATGAERHELPAAVAHQFGGGKLALCALVSRAPVSVRQIEAALGAAGPETLVGPDRAVTCRDVQVGP